MSLLICAAFPPEIDTLQARMGPRIQTATLGVGLVSAAASLGQVLAGQAVTRILFTGTCGALSLDELPIGAIVRARTVHLGDLGILSGDSFLPEVMPRQVTPARFLESAKGAVDFDVFCPLSITQTENGARLLQRKFPQGVVENLECFAVAQLATEQKIPCEIILGVSNQIGPNGHREWLKNHREVSRATQEWIYNYQKDECDIFM